MNDDQFNKLFEYMQGEFAQVRQEIQDVKAELKSDINHVYDLVDKDLKRRETDEQERLAMNHQLGRHEGWIKQVANKTDTKLAPEL